MSLRVAAVPARRARWLRCRREPGLGPAALLRLAVERTVGRSRPRGHPGSEVGLL